MEENPTKRFLEAAEKVHFADRRLLPVVPAVYAITNQVDIFYIGSSKNLKHRCGLSGPGTHIMFTIPNIHNYYIAFIQTHPSGIFEVERQHIAAINPPYNTYGKENSDTSIHVRTTTADRAVYERVAFDEGKNISEFIKGAVSFYLRYRELVDSFRTEFLNDL